MESFEGIQIFTTNRLKDLDNASLRRFNHKVEFGYLKPDGNVIFYEKLIAPLVRRPLDSNMATALKGLTRLTPGDFKVVRGERLAGQRLGGSGNVPISRAAVRYYQVLPREGDPRARL
jgi:hypothetical protein